MKPYALLTTVLALGIVLIRCSSLPRRSEQCIRERLLRETPQGSTYSAVLSYAKKQGWPVTEHSRGYETRKSGRSPATVVGKRAIEAYLGSYQGLPWHVDVDVYWAFDEHDKLIDVFVDKQADAL